MAFNSTNTIGPAITQVDTVPGFSIGAIIRAADPVQGEGEFIYLKGVASTVVGSVVIYDEFANTTKLAVAGDRGPIAVAQAATVAGTYGWYQISGSAVVKETGATAGGKPYVTATPGVPSITVVAGDKIDGAVFKAADGTPSAGFAYAQLARASLNGNG